jgi:hypothetical protein
MILLNNIIKLSKFIVLKEDDLKRLISILATNNDDSRVTLECELPDSFKTYQSCCSKIPIKHEFRN